DERCAPELAVEPGLDGAQESLRLGGRGTGQPRELRQHGTEIELGILAVAFEPAESHRLAFLAEGPPERRLAHAGLALDPGDAAMPAFELVAQLDQLVALARAADDRRQHRLAGREGQLPAVERPAAVAVALLDHLAALREGHHAARRAIEQQ